MNKQAPQALDLASLDTRKAANVGYELELTHPITGAKLGQFITVLGKDSDRYNELLHERINTAIRKRSLEARTGKDVEFKTSEQIDEEEIELLIACTVSFKEVNLGGPLDFNYQNAKKLYSIPWVKEQVNRAIADISNFILS